MGLVEGSGVIVNPQAQADTMQATRLLPVDV